MERYDSIYGDKVLGPSEIRVLRLNPASSLDPKAMDDEISSTTEIICLDDCPDFTALSYCWGTGAFDNTMICNGTPMKITESLDRALRWFRTSVADSFRNNSFMAKATSLVIWADAVCINQSNTDERNAQVQLMGRIYSQAARVFIYLGEESPSTAAGIALAANLWETASDWSKKHPDMDSPTVFSSMPYPPRHAPGWKGLIDILTRPWFSRCWIIQEFCMCANRIFVCGESSFTWMLFDTAVRLIRENSEVSTLLADKMAAGRKRDARFWDSRDLTSLFLLRALAGSIASDEWHNKLRGNRPPAAQFQLWDLLVDVGSNFEATNARDRVYSLMGMASDRESLPIPNYRLTVGETYEMFTKYFVTIGLGMDVISTAGMERRELDMPSWVPDWSTYPWPLTWNPFPNTRDSTANASKDSDSNVRLSSLDPFKLLASGALIDKIAHLSDPIDELMIGQNRTHKAWIHSAKHTLEAAQLALSSAEQTKLLSEIITAGDPDARVDDTILAFKALEQAMEMYIHLSVMMNPRPFDTALYKYKIYILSAVSIMAGTRLLVTEGGSVGLSPNPATIGDEVCIFAGGKTPYLVRRKGEEHFLVGKAYVRGVMQGEATESPDFKFRDIVLV